ncbi:hypothetical protein G6011_09964 [Alternaria panax]|uniref:Uncharacterized protein n=1 Tax=Alternaria panax TaxID=48097 RepID=A0AAD4FD25_9PLEO|nr:hypothetical protein G6011_09964 [Alternaria panax]
MATVPSKRRPTQPASHAQQRSGTDNVDEDPATEAHAKPLKAAPHWLANQGGTSQPQPYTNTYDHFATFDKKLKDLAYIPCVVSTKDAQLLLRKDCCPHSDPVSLLDGTWCCYECNTSSVDVEKTIAATMAFTASETSASDQAHSAYGNIYTPPPLLVSGDQEQNFCDSCGEVFFDKKRAKSEDSSMKISGGSTLCGPDFWGTPHSFEIANQGTDARRIMEENGRLFVAGGEIDDGSSS